MEQVSIRLQEHHNRSRKDNKGAGVPLLLWPSAGDPLGKAKGTEYKEDPVATDYCFRSTQAPKRASNQGHKPQKASKNSSSGPFLTLQAWVSRAYKLELSVVSSAFKVRTALSP